MGRKPITWTNVDRDYEKIRLGAPPTFRTADPIGSSAGKDLISGKEISEIHA